MCMHSIPFQGSPPGANDAGNTMGTINNRQRSPGPSATTSGVTKTQTNRRTKVYAATGQK